MKIVERAHNKLNVIFSKLTRPDFMVLIKEIQKLEGVTKSNAIWTVKDTDFNLRKLKDLGFKLQNISIKRKKYNAYKKIELSEEITKGLFPFQADGVRFLQSKNGRALIADEMRLGKTIQVVKYLHLNPELQKVLIVCPVVAKLNWQKELLKWLPRRHFIRIDVISPNKTSWQKKEYGCFIINFALLRKFKRELKKFNFDIIIIDECHNCKEPSALQTKALHEITKRVSKVIALSGTPIKSRPIEFYTTLNMLQPNQWGTMHEFGQRYCEPRINMYTGEYDYKGAKNIDELNIRLKDIMIRRKRVDVYDEPGIIEKSIQLELDDPKKYEEAEKDLILYIKENYEPKRAYRLASALYITKFEILKQLSYALKEREIFKWLDIFLQTSNEKMVLFFTHTKPIDNIMERYEGKIVKITGSVNVKDRDRVINEFNVNPDIRFFAGNIGACREAINLSVARTVGFFEFPWTPGELLQAKDRIQGLTQKAKETYTYYFFGKGTIDEYLCKQLAEKEKILNHVIDGEKSEGSSILVDLLNNYYMK